MKYYVLKGKLGYVDGFNINGGLSIKLFLTPDIISPKKELLNLLADMWNGYSSQTVSVVEVTIEEVAE